MYVLLTPLFQSLLKLLEDHFLASVSARSEAQKGKSYALKVSHLPDPICLLLPATQKLSLRCRAQCGLDAVHTYVNMMSL